MNRIVKYIKYKYHLGSTFLTQKFEIVPEPINYEFGVQSSIIPQSYINDHSMSYTKFQKKFNKAEIVDDVTIKNMIITMKEKIKMFNWN